MKKSNIFLITDSGHGSKHFESCKLTVSLKSPLWHILSSKLPGFRIFQELALGLKCWLVSISFRNSVPMVTFAGSHGFVFAFFQYCFRFIIKPRTHVVFDLLLVEKRKGIMGLLDGFKMYIFSKAIDLAIVWGETDPDTFSREYSVPKDKFLFHHYHTTRENFDFHINDEGFIFAGGNGARDYLTLIEAVKSINFPVYIATNLPGISELASPWKQITVKALPANDFYQKMASCKMLVECHVPNFFRTAGHQTILNAMWMGKPVIIADKKSSRGYIVDGEDGLVVKAGDVEGIKKSILQLLNNPDFAAQISANASKKIRDPEYSIPNTMQSIYNIAIKIQCFKNGINPEDRYIYKY